MKKVFLSLLVVFALVIGNWSLGTESCFADVPGKINYQGKLTDASGQLIDGTHSMSFTLFTEASGGGSVWTETHGTVTVTNGLFNVMLGSTEPLTTVFQENDALYLEIKVNTETLSPRQEMASVGYAVRSDVADTANGISAGATISCPSDMVRVGNFCIDKYEASVWTAVNGGGTQKGAGTDDYGSNDTGASFDYYAYSKSGVVPSRYITWFQAARACANSGKRLCTNQEWQIAALGTPDEAAISGAGGPTENSCNIWNNASYRPANTGIYTNCESDFGCYDMIGNLQEWVADWYVAGTNYTNSGTDGTSYTNWPTGTEYGSDSTWNVGGRAYNGTAYVDGLPAAARRGGYWGGGAGAGVFAFYADYAPSGSHSSRGFRCCR